MDIRNRLKTLGKTQVWLILELRKNGVDVRTSELSYILSGVNIGQKAQKVLAMCDTILKNEELHNVAE